ncbi:hypothetical protein B296_00045677 [Ensete ventricosum]|uniref:Uncharacterized protein n=1 Tax=Ensete ventricosum TaxID=4639 RepID=A0A426Y5R2_ENSVE|nr:hypothetical protein B296_00045677 [Ensete ventricosum]
MATFPPVSTFFANFTFAKVPSPSVRPSSYFPTLVLPTEPILLFPDRKQQESPDPPLARLKIASCCRASRPTTSPSSPLRPSLRGQGSEREEPQCAVLNVVMDLDRWRSKRN